MSEPTMTDQRRGAWIAIFGPDGAGKSAVIEQLRYELREDFRGMQRFHFRPCFAGRSEGRPTVTTPHATPPRVAILTMVKLLVWLIDYWSGYLTNVVPALRRQELVVFDRYYQDIIVDPRRYRVSSSCLRIANWMSHFIPQPDLSIVLDVPAQVLQARKPEVSVAESKRQRLVYRQLSKHLPNTFVIDGDRTLEQVGKEIGSIVRAYVAQRSLPTEKLSLVADV